MAFFAESLIGILLIIIGLLEGRFPNMLNIFSAEDRKKTDMHAVGRMTRNCNLLL